MPSPLTHEQSEEEATKADQQGRNDRAIAAIAESVTKTMDQINLLTQQAEEQRLQAEAQRLAFIEQIRELEKMPTA